MQFELDENQAVVWVIESPKIFRRFGQELMAQADGHEGRFILSDYDKQLDIKQNMEVILTPYAIDLNDKKCLNKIYAELKVLAYNEQYYTATQTVLNQIHHYLITLEQDTCIDLSFAEPDLIQLWKASGVKADDTECDLLPIIVQYLKIAVRLLDKKVLVFVNLSFYLEESEIEELLQEAFYLKVSLILIEQRELSFSTGVKYYIIDKDHCEIC